MMAKKRQRPQVQTERSPLLQAEQPFAPPTDSFPEPAAPPPPYSELQAEVDLLNVPGPSSNTVQCDVCSYMITKSTAKNKKVITCPRCNETTALQEPEKGKRYLRCPECNCLLIFKDTVSKTICPRERCKTTIDVKTGKPLLKKDTAANISVNQSIRLEPQYRITCGHCRGSFVQAALPERTIRCPLCRKKSHVGEGAGRRSGICYIVLGLSCVVTCLGLMASTMGLRHNAGFWYIYLVLLGAAIVFIALGLWNLCMRQSTLEIAAPPV